MSYRVKDQEQEDGSQLLQLLCKLGVYRSEWAIHHTQPTDTGDCVRPVKWLKMPTIVQELTLALEEKAEIKLFWMIQSLSILMQNKKQLILTSEK